MSDRPFPLSRKMGAVLAVAILLTASLLGSLLLNGGIEGGERPQADFSIDVSEGLVPLVVNFTDQSQNAISWAWDFNSDGVIDSEKRNPTFIFTLPGVYSITLTVSDGEKDSTKRWDNAVTVLPRLVADFAYSPEEGAVPLTVQFIDRSTGGATSWAWDFNSDGIIDSTERSPQYTYLETGTYAVKLTVSDSNETVNKTVTDAITAYESAPQASFTIVEGDHKVGSEIYLVDTSSGGPTSWAWDFNSDGVIDSDKRNPCAVYDSPGIYTITLKASNGAGDSTMVQGIKVRALVLPEAGFSQDERGGEDTFDSLTVQFTDHSRNATSWEWDFDNDGIIDSTERNPKHTFDPGTYTVSLKVSNIDGNDTFTIEEAVVVRTHSPPIPEFSANIHMEGGAVIVDFVDRSTNYPRTWAWDFDNDGIIDSTERNPTYSFGPGSYSVTLIVGNEFGDNRLTKKDFIVIDDIAPQAYFISDISRGEAPLTVHFTDASLNHPISWAWDFDGDGVIDSTKQHPVHVFTEPGAYNVSLTVSNLKGSSITNATIVVLERMVDIWTRIEHSVDVATVYDEIVFTITLTNAGLVDLKNVRVQLALNGREGVCYVRDDVSIRADNTRTIVFRHTVSWGDTESLSLVCSLAVLAETGEEFTDECRIVMIRTPYDWKTSQGDNYNSGVSMDPGPVGPTTPELKWITYMGEHWTTAAQPLIVDGIIYVCSPVISAVDANTGEIIWARPDLNSGGEAGEAKSRYTGVVEDGVFYVGNKAINARNGAVIWECTGIGPIGPAKYENGRLYVGALSSRISGGLYCIDARDGSIIWSATDYLPSQYSAPAIIGGYVVWASDTKIIVTDKLNGDEEQVVSVPAALRRDDIGRIRSSVVYEPGEKRIYVSADGGWEQGCLISFGFNKENGAIVERDSWLNPEIPINTMCTPVVYGGNIYLGYGSFMGGGISYYRERDLQLLKTLSGGNELGVQSNPIISAYGGSPMLYWAANGADNDVFGYGEGSREGWSYRPDKSVAQYSMSGAVPYNGYLYFMNDGGYLFCLKSYNAEPSIDPRPELNYDAATVGNVIEYELEVVNDGNVDFRDVSITVELEGFAVGYTAISETVDLPAGSSVRVRFSYTVSSMDLMGTELLFKAVCVAEGYAFTNVASVRMMTPSFHIDSDDELRQTAQERSWHGSGSAEDPFVVTGYLINASNGGAYLGNTTLHVVLQDLTVYGHRSGAGIELVNATNVVIADCELYDNKYGILSKRSTAIVRSNFIHDNSGYGINLTRCAGSKVFSNHLSDNNGAISQYVYKNRQANDDTGLNAWDVGGIGNLWDDLLDGMLNMYLVATMNEDGIYDRYPLGIANTMWKGSMNDPWNSGSNSAPSPDDAKNYWDVSLGSPLVCEPIMADGLVIFVTVEGIYVFDEMGNEMWRDRSFISAEGSCPCYSDGVLYVAYPKAQSTSSLVVRAHIASNGTLLWQADSLGQSKTPSSPLRTIGDRLLFIGSRDGEDTLFCLDNSTGDVMWTYESDVTRGFVSMGEQIILAQRDGRLVSMSSADGGVIDEVDVFEHFPIFRSQLSSSISYDPLTSSIYAVTIGRDLISLGFDPLTGTFIDPGVREGWTVPLAYPGSTPAIGSEHIYTLCGNVLYAVDKRNGEVDWMLTLRKEVLSSPAVSTYYEEDLVYIVCAERVICINGSGDVQWQLASRDHSLNHDSSHGAAISGTLVAYGNDKGNVIVIKKRVDLRLDVSIETSKWDAEVGDIIDIRLVLVNDGNVRLSGMPLTFQRIVDNVVVQTYKDELMDIGIGQRIAFTYSYTVTQDDLDRGKIYFKATATYDFVGEKLNVTKYHALGVTHDPVVIDGDDELTEFARENRLLGDGSADNPYVLESWLINANESKYCISISNTSKHIIISDCTFHNASAEWLNSIRSPYEPLGYPENSYHVTSVTPYAVYDVPYAGIRLFSSSNIVIQNCEFERCYVAIQLENCHDITVDGVSIKVASFVNSVGINIILCERVRVSDCYLSGITLDDAHAYQVSLGITETDGTLNIGEAYIVARQHNLIDYYGISVVGSSHVEMDANEFTDFHAFRASYVRGEFCEFKDGKYYYPMQIRGYTVCDDAWAIYIDTSEDIGLTRNSFTNSAGHALRIDGSLNVQLEDNSFGAYLDTIDQSGGTWYNEGGVKLPLQISSPRGSSPYAGYLGRAQLFNCSSIDIIHNSIYSMDLVNCTNAFVSRNEAYEITEWNVYKDERTSVPGWTDRSPYFEAPQHIPQRYQSGYLCIMNGRDITVSNNTGGNLGVYGSVVQVFENSYRRIDLVGVSDSIVSGNYLSNSMLDLDTSDIFVHLYDDVISAGYGSYLNTGYINLEDSNHNIIQNNAMNIRLYGSSYNELIGNQIRVTEYPEVLGDREWPDHIDDSCGVGIELTGKEGHQSDYNLIRNNNITHMSSYAVLIQNQYCSFNLIYDNVFDSNNGASKSLDIAEQAQALDKGQLNQWNTTTEIGNYWSDWQHRNGPYRVSTDSSAYDFYPMSFPLTYWEQHHKDESGSAAIDSNGLFDPANLTVGWQFCQDERFTGAIITEPVTGDGKVFVIDANSYVYALNVNTGERMWAAQPVNGDNHGSEYSTPAYSDHVLYLVLQKRMGSENVHVVALNTADGSVIWSNSTISAQGDVTAPVRYHDGRIYFSAEDGALYCMYASNGTLIWTYETDGGWGASACTFFNDLVICGDLSGKVYALDQFGRVSYTLDVNELPGIDGAYISSSIVVHDERPYDLIPHDARLCFSICTSARGYVVSVTIHPSGMIDINTAKWTPTEKTSSTPSVYGGKVYVGTGTSGSTSGNLYCIDADTGMVIWRRSMDGPVLGSPAIMIMFHGDIYVMVATANANGGLYVYDREGMLVHSHVPEEDKAGYSLSGPAIFDEAVIYANSRGYVYSISPNGSLPIANFIGSPVDGAVPLTVKFMDCSMYDPSNYTWDFNGDGVIDSYEENPDYIYPKIGTYTVTLTVSNFKGTSSIIKEFYIDVQKRRPSISVSLTASELSATRENDTIDFVLKLLNNGNLHLDNVTIDCQIIAHYREGGSVVRDHNTESVAAFRDRVQSYYLPYTITKDDLNCIYIECIYTVSDASEGLRYVVDTGFHIKNAHDPISIDGDDDLIAQAIEEGWKGTGSAEDPFIIENYEIGVHSVFWEGDILNPYVPIAIELRNVSLHLIVRNVTTLAFTDDRPGVDPDDPRFMNATAVHIIMYSCSNVSVNHCVMSPRSNATSYLKDNLNHGIILIDCHDVNVVDISMPAWGFMVGYRYEPGKWVGGYYVPPSHVYDRWRTTTGHCVAKSLLVIDSDNNLFEDIHSEERQLPSYYSKETEPARYDAISFKNSIGNTLNRIRLHSGGITLDNSDNTFLSNIYAKHGMMIESSDNCTLDYFHDIRYLADCGSNWNIEAEFKPSIIISDCQFLTITGGTFAAKGRYEQQKSYDGLTGIWAWDEVFKMNIKIERSSHVLIENNDFLGASLELNSCTDSVVKGNWFNRSFGTAITLRGCVDITVQGNDMDMFYHEVVQLALQDRFHNFYLIWRNGNGVVLNEYCANNNVIGNRINNCSSAILTRGTDNVIRDNYLKDSTYGIVLRGRDTAIGNTLFNCTHGVRLLNTDGSRVVSNEFIRSNIYISSDAKNVFLDNNTLTYGTFILDVTPSTSGNIVTITITDTNVVNGGRFIYMVGDDLQGATISDASQVVLIGVSNARIEGLTVTGGYNVITLVDCRNIIIDGLALRDMEQAIFLSGCRDVRITNSELQGLKMLSCSNAVVENCMIDGSVGYGIHIENDTGAVIRNVTVINSQGQAGIFIGSSESLTIERSNISYNEYHGIRIIGSSWITLQDNVLVSNYRDGINAVRLTDSYLSNNTIIDALNGILLNSSSYNIIVDNMLKQNIRFAVSLEEGSLKNSVYNNTFAFNRGSGKLFKDAYAQVADYGRDNKWNSNDRIGNIWYDWQNMQGMPYVISKGNPYIADRYPIDIRPIDHWNSPQHDPWHSGHTTSDVPRDNGTLWLSGERFWLTDGSSVVNGAGLIFAQSTTLSGTCYLIAYSIESGEVVWATEITSARRVSTFTPVYYNGLVLAPGGAYDAFTGKQVWRDNVTDHRGGGYVVYNDVAIIGDWGTGQLLAYQASTGDPLWCIKLYGFMESSPTWCDGDIIITMTNATAGFVYRIDVDNLGEIVWAVTLDGYGNRTVASATVDGDTIYVTTLNPYGPGHLYAMYANNGSIKWAIDIVSTASSVAVHDGRIYVSSGFDDVMGRWTYCINAADGSIIWKVAGKGSAYCAPVIADGVVIVGNHVTGRLEGEQYFIGTYALNATTGEKVWSSEQGGSSAMILDGKVYTMGMGRLVVFGVA